MRRIRKAALLLSAVILGGSVVAFDVGSDDTLLLKIHRGIDLFGKVYREATLNYVEEIDPDEFIRSGIDGMLRHLDPYTVYYDETEQDEIDLVTTGKYGGIGVTISRRDSDLVIVNILEGFSAARQGLQVGDRIVAIDGKRTDSSALQDVRLQVRGAPGTEIRMTIEREGEAQPLEFVLLREEISLRNVAYEGFVRDGIGYVRLERFSRTAGEDVRRAIKDLRGRDTLRGFILDLRDNPGGLLDMAVDVAAKFLPEKSLVVSTRGRRSDSERKYESQEIPVLPDVPMVVLVNRASASASEIVAGAIQDHDRGLIVGTRTFGKGLVQTITRLSEKTSLKMTTARYYTPSGRSIQEIDYSQRDGNGKPVVVEGDGEEEFRTAHRRLVSSGTGIEPDSVVPESDPGPFLRELQRRALLFSFANRFARTHGARSLADPVVTDEVLRDFRAYLHERKFEYHDPAERLLADLRDEAAKAQYGGGFLAHVQQLDSLVRREKELAPSRFEPVLRQALRDEIVGRVSGERARIAQSLADDPQVLVAADLLDQRTGYDRLLSGVR